MCLQAIRTGWVHPNINLDNPEKNVVFFFLTENFSILNVESVLTLFFITKFNMCWTFSIWNGWCQVDVVQLGSSCFDEVENERTNLLKL